MPSFRTARVTEIIIERPGMQRVRVAFEPDADPAPDGDRAVVLTDLIGSVAVGDDVVCNTTAVQLHLGTGGWHYVHWNLARTEHHRPGPGHVMKLRYTSLQFDAGTSELSLTDPPPTLDSTPVVACLLHSQAMMVAATIRRLRPGARIVYVMTDGASLPLAISDVAAEARRLGVIDASVTAGHAFGGDLEAVAVPSALTMARHHLEADVIVVGMGPGVAGTATALGTTSVEAAAVLDATRALGGNPVLAVRASSGDARDRHRGVSHHTDAVLRLTLARPLVASVPDALRSNRWRDRFELVDIEVPDAAGVLAASRLQITTMGRDIAADPLFFRAAAAAGALAVHHLPDP